MMTSSLSPPPTVEPAAAAAAQAFRSAHGLALEPALLTRPTGEVLAANPAACAVFGADEAVLIALSREGDRSRLADTGDPRLAMLLAERAATGRARGRLRLRRVDGTPFEAEIASHLFVDADGQAATMMFVRDLTDRIEAERAARVSEQRLRFALDAAAIGDWDMDLATNVARRSLRHDQCFGYRAPVPEWGYDTFLSHVHPDDRARVDACYRRAMAGEGEYDVEFRVLWPDGSLHWLWSRGRFYFDEAGRPNRVAGIQVEVTAQHHTTEALRRSEERLRLALRGSSDAHWDFDLQTGESYYSPRWLQMVGDEAAGDEALDSQWWLSKVHPDDLERVRQAYGDALDSGAETFHIEFRLRHRNGHDVPVLARGFVLRDADGRPLRVSGTNTDMTERQRLLQAQQARSVAEAANRAKTEFLSRISHELRTPLNAVLGFAQLLQSETGSPLDALQAERVAHVERAGQHLLNLVDDVLDLSRIDAGEARLKIQPLDVLPLVRECAGLLEGAAVARGIVLGWRVDAAVGGVSADLTRTRQILLNLLSNAVKYSPAGGRVDLTVLPDGRAGVALSVADEGPGLSAAQQAQLFEPFNRLGREGGDTPGTGIGLAISRRLAELMGGTLTVRSEPGAGCVFTLCLCAADTPAPAGDTAAAPARDPPTGTGAAPRRVLYIEDNETNAELMRGIFRLRPRLSLQCAARGGTGIDAARQRRPDLVLLDWQLPDMTGADVLRQLRADPKTADLPVVIISASVLPETQAEARAAGATEFVSKPLSVGHMLATLDRLVP